MTSESVLRFMLLLRDVVIELEVEKRMLPDVIFAQDPILKAIGYYS